MRLIPRRAKSIPWRQVKIRLLLTLSIYLVSLLAVITLECRLFRSFVSLADSRLAVESRNANGDAFAFLRAATFSSAASIDSLNLDPVAARRNPTAVFSMLAPLVPQPGDSKIVFTSNRDGSMQIYVMNGDGSGVMRLSKSAGNDDYPRWSPNASTILFQSDRDHLDTGYLDIYLMKCRWHRRHPANERCE